MTAGQIILYALAAVVFLLLLRRAWQIRSLPRYSAAELETVMKEKNPVLLDVRTERERRTGAIKGSMHIPLQSLRVRMGELERHRNREIICYCQSGNRSMSAALLLRRNGFRTANLQGGMGEWNFLHR